MNEQTLLIDRRVALGALLMLPTLLHGAARAGNFPPMVVYRDPGCGCCHKWVDHRIANGFAAEIRDTPNMPAVKARFGIPPELKACHTAEIGGYVIEGHVPALALKRLMAEKPAGRGLAVPGMPVGSPGMEVGDPEAYDVMLFGDGPPRQFGRFKGASAV